MGIRMGIVSASICLSTVVGAHEAKAERLTLGKYQSRGIWSSSEMSKGIAPLVILLPGSGSHGPEEMIPGALTVDGKDHSIFDSFSKALNQGGLHTLALGKPGIEFFTGWDPKQWSYDLSLYTNLHWEDLIQNLAEAVAHAKSRKDVDPAQIYVLGHSEGTQVAIDYAATDPSIAGLILLGFAGEDMATTVDWQFFKRSIEYFVSTDVDSNHDGWITREEADRWRPQYYWPWEPGRDQMSYEEIERIGRTNRNILAIVDQYRNAPLYSRGIWNRGPIYQKAADLPQALFVFTGALDLQTPAREALSLKEACLHSNKMNCEVIIVPGVGHGFSPPRGPRAHPLLDITVGPVETSFQDLLTGLARRLVGGSRL